MSRFASGKTWTLMLMALLSAAVIEQALQIAVPAVATVAAQEENPVGPADAAAAPAQEAAPAAGAPAEESAPKRQSLLAFFFNALGWRYTIAFLVISFTFVAFLVMNLLGLRRDAVCPPHLIEAFEANLNEKRFQEAFDLAKN